MRAAACFLEAGHSIQRAASHAASRSNVVIMADDNTAFIIVILFAFIVFAFLVVNVGLCVPALAVAPRTPRAPSSFPRRDLATETTIDRLTFPSRRRRYFYARKVFPPKPPKKVGAKKKKREAMKQGSRQA